MKTNRRGLLFTFLVLLATATLPRISGAEGTGFNNFSELKNHYLQERAWVAPMIPPLLPSSLEILEVMILNEDFSFQNLAGWYFPWTDGPYTVDGDLSAYDGQKLVIYEDLVSDSIKITTTDGALLVSFANEPFPNLSYLNGDNYDRAILAELNKRSITFLVSFQNYEPEVSAYNTSAYGFDNDSYSMMSMGGSSELEVVEFELTTNSEMAVTFAWPGDFTNRLDIYSCDGSNYNGLGSWKLADIGYSTAGTNQLRWLDLGQLGRGSALNAELRFYTAGKGGDVDSDGDGYGDSYEHLVKNTDINDPDSDDDNVSDGPFDPDNTNSIIAGPDAFPLDASEWIDTDGDGIGDNADTDDDGDGKPDSVETNTLERLIPITVAPFRAVTVESTDPSGDDSGTEVFDVSSAGRMLPYATGGDARGQGQIHGGIFFNNDGTNLYVGVAGFEKDGNNALMIFLDTDSTNGGAVSLSGISGTPSAFGQANNLSFNATSFTPNVGILVGNRYADGKNDATSMGMGQGVYALTPTTVSDFSGFTSSSGPISQWGDRGTDSANAGIEIAISLSSLGLTIGDTFKAAAIINGGTWGANDRWFSGECYGETVGGTLAGNNFEGNAVNLIGAEVYVSNMQAPEPSDPPLFTDNDVMLQGYTWNSARPPRAGQTTMTVAGSFNSWNPGLNNMTLVGDNIWEYLYTFANATGVAFKFTANGAWTVQWGDTTTNILSLPITNAVANQSAGDIELAGTINGLVRFRIDTGSARYDVVVTNGATTTLLPGFSAKFHYRTLQDLAESNSLSKFTAVWMPPPQKGSSGDYSTGYDPFDWFDLGTYDEKGSVNTRYGSEAELKACVSALRNRGMLPIIDLVMNHMHGGYSSINYTSSLYRFNYQPGNHNTFEKVNTNTPPDGNNYFNVNYKNTPFSQDQGYGNSAPIQPADDAARSADINQRHPYQRQGLKNWATWVSAKAGYRGYRWDVAQNIEPWFISEVMNYEVMKGQPGIMEYWTESEQATVEEFATWLELTDRRAAMFDQRLYFHLEDMCNFNGTFNMSLLRNAGLNSMKPQWAVTLAGDHDKTRPYGGGENKWGILKDKPMAYAFIMISEGTPMVSYNDYFLGWKVDIGNPDDLIDDGWTGGVLTNEIDRLVDARRMFAGGSTEYLSQANTNDLFIMKRTGSSTKPGCILVLNDHTSSTLSDTVNTGWASTNLVDFINTNVTVTTDSSGNALLSAPSRSYRVYVRQGDL